MRCEECRAVRWIQRGDLDVPINVPAVDAAEPLH